MDCVWVGEAPCCKFAPYVGYMSKVSDHVEFEEVHILCALWNFSRPCSMSVGIDGGPCEDRCDHEFGSSQEFKIVAHDLGNTWYYKKIIKAYA